MLIVIIKGDFLKSLKRYIIPEKSYIFHTFALRLPKTKSPPSRWLSGQWAYASKIVYCFEINLPV